MSSNYPPDVSTDHNVVNDDILISREQFDRLSVPRGNRGRRHSDRPEAQALWNLPMGKGLVLKHGKYQCSRARDNNNRTFYCSLGTAAHSIAKQRRGYASVKHLADGRLAVFYQQNP